MSFVVNKCFTTGHFPYILKLLIIRPLYKRGDTYLTANRRQISILPTVSKLMELHIKNRIVSYLTSKQHGFMAYHSTVTAIINLIPNVCEVFDENMTT